MKSRGSKLNTDRAPLHTEDVTDYQPSRNRVPGARQLCHGSNRELPAPPQHGRCPIEECGRRIEVQEVLSGRRDPRTHEIIKVYITPSHQMPRK